jgi:hypothetical protein
MNAMSYSWKPVRYNFLRLSVVDKGRESVPIVISFVTWPVTSIHRTKIYVAHHLNLVLRTIHVAHLAFACFCIRRCKRHDPFFAIFPLLITSLLQPSEVRSEANPQCVTAGEIV